MESPEVLVVGAGPTGLAAALLLEQQGMRTEVIDRRDGPQRAPAAHAINARTLEICRSAGVDMERLRARAARPEEAGFVYWVTRLGGRVIGRLPYEQQGDDQLALTPTPLRNLSQSQLEPLLLEALAGRARREPAWRVEWLRSEPRGEGLCSTVRDLETGGSREIQSAYVIGADGAGSRVRKSLGIDVVGPARLQSFVMVHLRTRLRGIPEVPPGVIFFVCDPKSGGGVFVVHHLDREAVFMLPYDPEVESADDYDVARCADLVRGALEDPSLDFEIENVGTWAMTAQVAERYRCGRVFLAGDAAHRFPPTGGLGLNSGVQDAHNLAWKLAAVQRGWASERLLESYERERRPVAQTNADQSLRNAMKLFQVIACLGIHDDSDASLERMQATLASEAGRARVAAAVADQAEHFDMPGLQLGFCYGEGALVRGADDTPPALQVRRFTPCGCPGARLPHAWLGAAPGGESLLDRVPLDGFLLLVGPEGRAWLDALDRIGDVPMTGLQLDAEALPGLDTWLAQAGLDAEGALLVRPDQHVAWRCRGPADEPARELTRALAAVLSRG